ncbi:MAG TPA: YraN family protein [Vicinamibacterales bacterium]|nr:YraN family protein [Vicinamibacterales bacterium]
MPAIDDRQTLGKLGEQLASDELRRRGYSILATRHRTRFGEIDIVCERNGAIAFVEAKARRTTRYGSAIDAITPWKRRRIAAMALDYLASAGKLELPCSFIVVAIDQIGTPKMTIRVIEDAWTVDR